MIEFWSELYEIKVTRVVCQLDCMHSTYRLCSLIMINRALRRFLNYTDTFCCIDFLDVLSGILQHPIT